jgi:hypothetical protein
MLSASHIASSRVVYDRPEGVFPPMSRLFLVAQGDVEVGMAMTLPLAV